MSFAQKLPLPPLTSDQARALAKQRRHPGGRNARAMFAEAQELLLKDIRNKKTTPAIRAKCVIALDKCEERLRILNGKPLPGQLRPDLPPAKDRKRKGPSLLPLPEVPNRTAMDQTVSADTTAAQAASLPNSEAKLPGAAEGV